MNPFEEKLQIQSDLPRLYNKMKHIYEGVDFIYKKIATTIKRTKQIFLKQAQESAMGRENFERKRRKLGLS